MPIEEIYAATWKASLDAVQDSAVKNCLIVFHEWLLLLSSALMEYEKQEKRSSGSARDTPPEVSEE